MDTTLDPVTREYLSLSLAIERAFPGFVDAYFGPPEIKQAADAGDVPSPADLLARARTLEAAIAAGDYPAARRDFLRVQTRAIVAVCQKLAGEELPYRAEVEAFFDIEPAHTSEARFDEAIDALDRALPGSGDVRQRMIDWRANFTVTPEMARALTDRILEEARRRTSRLVDLPEVESIEIRMVSDQPWSGYNWYLGGNASRVEINTDLPIRANALVDLICHEAYPGHHTEHALKEQRLYRDLGYGEAAIQLINTPECVISEGIATLAESVIFPNGEAARWANDDLYPLASVTGDAEREIAIGRATRALRAVNANAALLLHDAGAPQEEVVGYLMRYGLRAEEEARHSLAFITSPLWRAYVFCYHAGRDLLQAWLDQAADDQERDARFRRLLTEQITPSAVAGWVKAGA